MEAPYEKWNNFACVILDAGAAMGKARRGLAEDTSMVNAATESDALEIFPADDDLPVVLFMGPHAGPPRNARGSLKKTVCSSLISCGRAEVSLAS